MVPEVVDAELQLEPVGRASFVDRHQACVVDEQVEPLVLRLETVGEGGHRGQVGQVELPDIDQRGRHLTQQLPAGGLGPAGVAASQYDPGAAGGEHPGDLEAEARVGARHDGEAAGPVGDVGSAPAGQCMLLERR